MIRRAALAPARHRCRGAPARIDRAAVGLARHGRGGAPATIGRAAVALALLAVAGCPARPVATVTLALTAPPEVDAATLTVSASGMEPVTASVLLPGGTFSLEVPAGLARRFELRASGAGAPLWVGVATFDLAPGDVSITLPAVPGGAVHGRLTFGGSVVPGATLTFAAFDPPPDFPSWYTDAADAAGDYAAWLPAGSYVVMAGLAGAAVPPDRSGLTVASGVDSRFDVDLVDPAALARLVLEVPSVLTGGLAPLPATLTVRALDAAGGLFAAYAGTVTFAGSDLALFDVPPDYTFTAADAGAHDFTVTPLLPAGLGILAVEDVDDPSLAASVAVVVGDPGAVAGAAVELVLMVAGIAGGPVPQPGTLTVAALDADGLLAGSYLGTISFSESDLGLLTAPPDYTFTPADGGTHVFPDALLPLVPLGSALVRARDVSTPSIFGELLIDIL